MRRIDSPKIKRRNNMVCAHDFQIKTTDGRIVCLKCKETLRKVGIEVKEENRKIKGD
jgi:hypothetical protein